MCRLSCRWMLWLVWCIALYSARGVRSDADVPPEPSCIVHVAGWPLEEAAEQEFPDRNQTVCGSILNKCPSLRDALDSLRTPSSPCFSESSGQGNPPTQVLIKLHGVQANDSQCRVWLFLSRECKGGESQLRVTSSPWLHQYHLVIDGNNTAAAAGCSRSVLVSNCTGRTKKVPLVLDRASLFTFRSVRFDSSIMEDRIDPAHQKATSGLVKIVDSRIIRFSDCIFWNPHSSMTSMTTVVVRQSCFVVFRDCRFYVAAGCRCKYYHPALRVRYESSTRYSPATRACSTNISLTELAGLSEFYPPDEVNIFPEKNCLDSQAGNKFNSLFAPVIGGRCPPSLLLFGCSISNCQPQGPMMDTNLLKTVESVLNESLRNVTSSALMISLANIRNVSGYKVMVHGCAFSNNTTPLGSTVFVLLGQLLSSINPSDIMPSFWSETAIDFTNTTFFTNSAFSATALHIDFMSRQSFSPPSVHPVVTVKNCQFSSNLAINHGGAVAIHNLGSLCRVNFSQVSFSGNVAEASGNKLPGGAVAVVHGKPLSSGKQRCRNLEGRSEPLVRFHDCTFQKNDGRGALYLEDTGKVKFTGKSDFSDNLGESAIILRDACVEFQGDLLIKNNRGLRGAGIYMSGLSDLDLSLVSNFTVTGNKAIYQGTAVFINLPEQPIAPLDLTRGDIFQRCPLTFPKNFASAERSHERKIFFEENPSEVAGVHISALFITSMTPCFKEQVFISLIRSLYEVEDPLYCMPYAPYYLPGQGNTAELCQPGICDLMEQFSPAGNWLESCALGNSSPVLDRNCSPHAANEAWQPAPSSSSQASAEADMSDYQATSVQSVSAPPGSALRPTIRPQALVMELSEEARGKNPNQLMYHCNTSQSDTDFRRLKYCQGKEANPIRVCNSNRDKCLSQNAFFHQPPNTCYSRSLGIYVRNQRLRFSDFAELPLPFGTKVAWLVFSFANTSCYKMMDDKVWYFYRGCNSETVLDRILKEKERMRLETDCTLSKLAQWHTAHSFVIPPMLPGYKFSLFPWASSSNCWLSPPSSEKYSCLHSFHSGSNLSISSIVLQPAPGETFDLDFDALDEFFQPLVASVLLSVISPDDDVLLGHSTFILKSKRTSLYKSGYAMKQLVLYGRPGSEGLLKIVAKDFRVPTYWQRSAITLMIPFHLRRCHLGFHPLTTNSTHAKKLVRLFSMAETLASTLDYKEEIKKYLMCQCRESQFCVDSCENGKDVYIKQRCWAGLRKDQSATNLLSTSFKIPSWFSQTAAEFKQNQEDPVGILEQVENSFAADVCNKGSCSTHHGKEIWHLGQDNPCTNQSNTRGPFCSVCMEEYTFAVQSASCIDCDKYPTVPLAVFFLLLFIVLAVAFSMALVLNIGVTAPLDSWLFFSQVFYCIHGSTHSIKSFYVQVVTLGLGSVCITEQLSPLSRSSSLVAPPLMSFALLAIFQFIADKGIGLAYLQKLQHRKSIRHVLWLVILWSTAILVYKSLTLMRCVSFDGTTVTFLDARIECFKAQHAPFVVLGALTLTIFVLPVPVLLIWKPVHRWPSLKGLLDEATNLYEPELHWWAWFNILRRIIYSAVVALVTTGLYRRSFMSILTMVMLALHGYFRPFDRSMTIWKVKDCNNTLEFLLLLTLCVLSGYRVLQVDVQHGPATDNNTLPTVVFCVATVISLGIYLYQFISSWRDTIQQRPRNIVYEDDGEEDTEESESESAEHFESRVKEDMEMEVMVVEVKPARAEYRVCHAARSPKTPQWGNYSRSSSFDGSNAYDTSLRESLLAEQMSSL